MIALLRQIQSGSSASYVLERDGQTCCTAEVPFSIAAPGIALFRQGEPWLRITPNLGDSVKKMVRNGSWRTVPCDITDASGAQIGTIAKIREGTFLSANYYTELRISGRVLQIYEVGLGKAGMRYPVYEGGVQLSQVEKEPVALDNLDEYSLCSLDDFGELAALLFALFIDFHSYRNAGEHARGKKSFQYIYTRRKEIFAKYDPDFRSRCEIH